MPLGGGPFDIYQNLEHLVFFFYHIGQTSDSSSVYWFYKPATFDELLSNNSKIASRFYFLLDVVDCIDMIGCNLYVGCMLSLHKSSNSVPHLKGQPGPQWSKCEINFIFASKTPFVHGCLPRPDQPGPLNDEYISCPNWVYDKYLYHKVGELLQICLRSRKK